MGFFFVGLGFFLKLKLLTSTNILGQNVTLHPAPLQAQPSNPLVKMSLCVTFQGVQRHLIFLLFDYAFIFNTYF